MQRVIFLVHRILYYRYYVSLIDEAIARGFIVEVWHDYSQPQKGSKGYSFPDLNLVPPFKGQVIKNIFRGKEELGKLLIGLKNKDMVFSLHPPCFYWKEDTEQIKVNWVTLQRGPDSFHELCDIKNEDVFNGTFALHSKKWLESGKDFLSKFSLEKNSGILQRFKMQIVGHPEFDSFKYVDNGNIVRKKYGIPENKNILLYLSFPYQNLNSHSAWERAFAGLGMNTFMSKGGLWVHNKKNNPFIKRLQDRKNRFLIAADPCAFNYLEKGISEDSVFKSIRQFCCKHNLFFVVKPRLKFPISQYIKENCDLLVLDDEKQNLPTRFKELLSISSLLVSYYSLSVLSAAFASVYHINIAPPDCWFPDEKSKFFCLNKSFSMFDFEGVSSTWMPQEIIDKLPDEDLQKFSINREARARYINDFIGFDDLNSSKRLFNVINEQ